MKQPAFEKASVLVKLDDDTRANAVTSVALVQAADDTCFASVYSHSLTNEIIVDSPGHVRELTKLDRLARVTTKQAGSGTARQRGAR